MSNTAIKVEDLSKIYRLGEIGTGSISQDVDRWFKTKILGKEDPFLIIGESNDRSKKGSSDIVYSLQDINFEIQQGDAIGIIGRNGAGKSTLLKILSRVTTPTTGRINIRGRVASLLEVGTGFHPELTGRENIYLNGAILGMRKREIDRKLEEIIDFSGVERYIDTPVKRYSSGMYVRLAFAVAAHLESEILIVDEVLAVGDAEFQKKCLGKMGEVRKGEGRTVLFVSHNMASIKALCNKGLVLINGRVEKAGDIQQSIQYYLDKNKAIKTQNSTFLRNEIINTETYLKSGELLNIEGVEQSDFQIDEDVFIKLNIVVNQHVPALFGYITISDSDETLFIESDTKEFGENELSVLNVGSNWLLIKIPAFTLPHGEKFVYINFSSPQANRFNIDSPGYILKFNITDNITTRNTQRKSMTSQILKWNKIHV